MTDLMKLATDYAQACYHLDPHSYDPKYTAEARAALQSAIEALQAENAGLRSECAEHKENAMRNARIAVSIRAEREKDAFRLVWAMNWMRMSVHDHGFTKHVLERGGTADYSDCATYIDKCTTATQEAAHGIHAKGGQ